VLTVDGGTVVATEAIAKAVEPTPMTITTVGVEIGSLTLGTGSWIVFSRVDGAHVSSSAGTRLECDLQGPGATTLDYAKIRLTPNTGATTESIFASISMHGAVTLAAPGTIKMICGSTSEGEGIALASRHMSAIKVGSLTMQ
jgi:hypothetical protein